MPTALALALAIQACAPQFDSQESCTFVQNSYGERVSWKGQLPIVIYAHTTFPEQYLGAIQDAVEYWNRAKGEELFRYGGRDSGPDQARYDGRNIIYWRSSWEANKTSEQARTQIQWEGNRILDADILINNKDFDFYYTDVTSSGAIHIGSILVHEFGHVLGLAHNDNEPSVMGTYLRAQTVREEITQADLRYMSCEY